MKDHIVGRQTTLVDERHLTLGALSRRVSDTWRRLSVKSKALRCPSAHSEGKKTDGGREKVLNVSFSLHPMGQIQAQDTVCIFLLCFSLQLQLPLVNVHFPGPIETWRQRKQWAFCRLPNRPGEVETILLTYFRERYKLKDAIRNRNATNNMRWMPFKCFLHCSTLGLRWRPSLTVQGNNCMNILVFFFHFFLHKVSI